MREEEREEGREKKRKEKNVRLWGEVEYLTVFVRQESAWPLINSPGKQNKKCT